MKHLHGIVVSICTDCLLAAVLAKVIVFSVYGELVPVVGSVRMHDETCAFLFLAVFHVGSLHRRIFVFIRRVS